MIKKPFLITIDTEGDNLWSKPVVPTVENAKHISRFQDLCDSSGFKPTYLTNYEMARAPAFVVLARAAIARGAAEVGCHIHAWDSPPAHPLTVADHQHHPYLIEYPDDVLEAKLRLQTTLLEDQFGCKVVSHRAGRWAFNERYAEALIENGYRVDCSVTPGVSWRATMGCPDGLGGTDYTHFPTHAYYLDPGDIARAGGSTLLEVPMTTRRSWCARSFPAAYRVPVLRRLLGRYLPEVSWLRPKRGNLEQMCALVASERERAGYLEFMMHSSEFMPGGSPYFKTKTDVDRMFDDLRSLFDLIARTHRGVTLAEYGEQYAATGSNMKSDAQ